MKNPRQHLVEAIKADLAADRSAGTEEWRERCRFMVEEYEREKEDRRREREAAMLARAESNRDNFDSVWSEMTEAAHVDAGDGFRRG